MEAADPSHPSALPRAYAAWRCRMLTGVIVATALGLLLHGPTGEVRAEFDEWPSPWLLIGVLALAVCFYAPGLVGTCLALAAVWSWRRLRTSSRFARGAWVLWVLGPLPVLLLPLAYLFSLNPEDSLKTSASQVRYLLTITAPAFFALLPGTLNAALELERFLPESQLPGKITLLAAPACTVAYLLPLGVLAQLAFHPGMYLGLLLLAGSCLVPLLAVRGLLRRDTPNRAARLVRTIVVIQGALGVLGVALIVWWLGEHPLLRSLLGEISTVWVLGLAAKVLASKWLTTVVVTDLLVSMLHQARESAQSLESTARGEVLAQKLDALGHSLRPAGPAKDSSG
ncbi:MAG TPA: hypothetical protein VKE98_18165 [Gemmataceae bacterium]|nr:hypothetical protein [Gemmataceae bacterium]